jgi:NADPH-dependent 2,4-dienoyl-CoA reductase/sulfur reductase-like enzyme
MIERRYDSIVVGGGSAGMAAALRIAEQGFRVAVLERENDLGGILQQCIHNGFGLHYYEEELTGPEYAERFIRRVVDEKKIDIYEGTTALDVAGENEKTLYAFSRQYGVITLYTKTVVLAMGCRERNRGNIGIPGTRPAGIFTAGLAQRLINVEGYIPGKRAVIIGSGDIGLIMARRMTWVGSEVPAVIEIQPYPSGLTRNIVQCLNDFGIPLYLSHVVTYIGGRDRVEWVEVTPIEDGISKPEKRFTIECDTLLLSVGLIPDNELSKKFDVRLNQETSGAIVDANLMTSEPGVFACGNVLHVHDLVDFVTEESERCGRFVGNYLKGVGRVRQYRSTAGANVKYVVPNKYTPDRDNRLYLRSLVVKNKAELTITIDGEEIKRKRLSHVQPSEMVSVTLEPEDFHTLSDLKDNVLEVNIR